MISVKLVLMIVALLCFLLAAVGAGWSRLNLTSYNLIGLGLFFLTFAMIVT